MFIFINITIFKSCYEQEFVYAVLNMPEETWHGIPRSKIPWYPTIDYEKCINCGKCVEYCTLGTYTFEERNGKRQPVVENPNNCVVLCKGCDSICPAEAIKHPLKTRTQEIIKELRKTYSLEHKRAKRSNP
jgi:NAD-dependent dihydropyrimidine dehydrogenase PreA subunit